MPAISSTPVGRSPIPDEFLRASHAPPARTLVDLLRSTAEAHPDAPAIDDGSTILEYAELVEAVIAGAYALNDAGVASYNHQLAREVANVGVPAFAATPNRMVEVIERALRGESPDGSRI